MMAQVTLHWVQMHVFDTRVNGCGLKQIAVFSDSFLPKSKTGLARPFRRHQAWQQP
jgi:hypothetical protein